MSARNVSERPATPSDAPLSLEEIDRLLGIAAKHGVIHLAFRGFQCQRVPADVKADRPTEKETELERLSRMSADRQDSELMLRRIPGAR
jgi:hypothetical protein